MGTAKTYRQARHLQRMITRKAMAWNPSPKVADAREIARKHGADQVIIVMIDNEADTMEYASYGETPTLCDRAKRLADVAYDAIFDFLSG